MDQESIRCRFGYFLAKLTEGEAAQRTCEGTNDEKALAIFDGQQKRIVAVSRCYLDLHTAEAKVALVVTKPLSRLGLGRFLLDRLIEVALVRIEHFPFE